MSKEWDAHASARPDESRWRYLRLLATPALARREFVGLSKGRAIMARSQKFSNLALVFLTGGGLHRRLLLVAFLLLAAFVPVAIASGDGGALDPSFGIGGRVTTDFRPSPEFTFSSGGAAAIAIQGDGKIVAAGFAQPFRGATATEFAFARYNIDGSLDTSFGDGGEVTTDFGGNGDVSQGIAIQMNGRIVAVGYTEGDTDTDFALARYKTDGTIEKSFGRAGRVTTDFNGTRDSAAAVAIQRNGRIVAAGQSVGGAGGDFALARYKTNGSLDRSFGSGGKISTDFGGDDAAQALAIQTDGRLVAAGVTVVGGGSSFALARYFTR